MMKQVFISYTEGDDDFRIVGKDYQEVLKHLCVFLNDQLNFPYQFSMEYIPKEIEDKRLAWMGGFKIEENNDE